MFSSFPNKFKLSFDFLKNLVKYNKKGNIMKKNNSIF